MALLPSLNAFLMFPLHFVSIFLIRARSVAIMTNLLSLVRAITISYPRNLTSKVRGLKKRNLTYFEKIYGNITFTWRENNDIDTVQCSIDGMVYVV